MHVGGFRDFTKEVDALHQLYARRRKRTKCEHFGTRMRTGVALDRTREKLLEKNTKKNKNGERGGTINVNVNVNDDAFIKTSFRSL